MNKTVFLDRDGVINKRALLHEYIKTWDEFEFLPKAGDGVRLLGEAGYRVVIVTNQRGIARGLMTDTAVQAIHDRMLRDLAACGAHIDGIYVCPHEAGTCNCRKPDIGLFLLAERDLPVDKQRSYMVGDSISDIEAGRRYGIKTIMIGVGCGADFQSGSLYDAACLILRTEGTI